MVHYECPRCGYKISKTSSMVKHLNRQTLCKLVNEDIDPRNFIEEIIKMGNSRKKRKNKDNEIEQLKEKIKKLEEERGNQKKYVTINNTTHNNITIVLNPVNDPQYEHLTDRDYQQCLNRMIMSVPTLIKKIHFDPKHPENHNLYIPNIQQKYAMAYNGKEWQLKSMNDTINNLLRNHEMILEEWIDCGGDGFPKVMNNFKTYLGKREENGVEDTIKEEIKLLLYNKRKMIKGKNEFKDKIVLNSKNEHTN